MHSGLPISDSWFFFASCYGWDGTSENRLEIAILEWGGSLWSKVSRRRGYTPPTICAWLDRPVNALQLCHWKFLHKETLQQTFFERSTLVEEKMVNLHFLSPFGGLGATYAVHLRLIGKLVVGLPISDSWTFLLGPVAEPLRANINWKSPFMQRPGQFAPKISGRRGRPPLCWTDSLCWKTRFPFIWYKNVGRSYFHFVTIHEFVKSHSSVSRSLEHKESIPNRI